MDIFLTGKKICFLMLLFLSCLYLLVVSLLSNVTSSEKVQNDDKGNVGVQFQRSKSNWPVPGANKNHLHVFVQVSDLHISVFFDSKRYVDFSHFLKTSLSLIRPDVVLLTGDITDAKLRNFEGSEQNLKEWQIYQSILNNSKILKKTVWLDTRGNHDAFDVRDTQSQNNYFKKYSVKGLGGQLSYHYQHRTPDGDVTSFIAVDACLNPGPKRPFNFFGMLQEVCTCIGVCVFLRNASESSNVTILFGHYPTSVISSPSSAYVRSLFRSGLAYFCGHLHTFAGMLPNMYTHHKEGFLELELGDWKDSRLYRIIALDHGMMSFVDVINKRYPIIIVTNPKDEKFAVEGKEPLENIHLSTHIRHYIIVVIVVITTTRFKDIDQSMSGLYVLQWDPSLYKQGFHVIEVTATPEHGKAKVKQGFSMDGSKSSFGFVQRFVLKMDHTYLFKVCFTLAYIASIFPLLFFRINNVKIMVLTRSKAVNIILRTVHIWLQRFCLLTSVGRIYYPLLTYNLYIVVGPWFIGYVLSEHIGACFLFGIVVDGTLIYTSLTYLYGFFQLLLFNIPLMLYLSKFLDLSNNSNNCSSTCCQSNNNDNNNKSCCRSSSSRKCCSNSSSSSRRCCSSSSSSSRRCCSSGSGNKKCCRSSSSSSTGCGVNGGIPSLRVVSPIFELNFPKMMQQYVLAPIRHVYRHLILFVVVIFQVYLILTGFLKSYGFLAFMLCPLRTWAILLALYLHYQIHRYTQSKTSNPMTKTMKRHDSDVIDDVN
ncbi:hypothetical protein HELRODRAFT_112716, partial [Helobdella robusta]|uniref:Uncharacterized protein n=1 Tax=Helobdella robusta TaxID=6412 RepID=T1EFL5_HELRO